MSSVKAQDYASQYDLKAYIILYRGRRGLMVMAMDCGAGGCEFKPRCFQKHF